MELDARKQKILAAVIEQYIETGEPIGSKNLLNALDFSVSSATIRNEMAALSEMGYLEQPHTSAGRIPSQKGFRFYLDMLIELQPISEAEMRFIDDVFKNSDVDPQKLIGNAGHLLADITNCAAIAATPSAERSIISRIEILPVSSKTFLLLMVTSSGAMKNRICRTDFEVSVEALEFFVRFINEKFKGIELDTVTTPFIQTLAVSMGQYSLLLTPLLYNLFELAREISSGVVMLEGEANLLNHKELDVIARDLLKLLSNPNEFLSLVPPSHEGVNVIIGSELSAPILKDTSVLVTRYNIAGDLAGTIGIIGPTRINYAKIIPHIEYFAKVLGRILKDNLD